MANYEPKHVGDMVILNITVCILLSVFCGSVAICIVSANTTFRTPHVHLSSAISTVLGHHQVDYTATYMENKTEVEYSPYIQVQNGKPSIFFSVYFAVQST